VCVRHEARPIDADSFLKACRINELTYLLTYLLFELHRFCINNPWLQATLVVVVSSERDVYQTIVLVVLRPSEAFIFDWLKIVERKLIEIGLDWNRLVIAALFINGAWCTCMCRPLWLLYILFTSKRTKSNRIDISAHHSAPYTQQRRFLWLLLLETY